MKKEEDFEFEEGFGNIIVVDNLPVVPKEKFEKLEGVVRKIYSQIGVIKEDGLWMPTDPDTHKTLGYCFIEYNTPQVLLCFFSSFFRCKFIPFECLSLVMLKRSVFYGFFCYSRSGSYEICVSTQNYMIFGCITS